MLRKISNAKLRENFRDISKITGLIYYLSTESVGEVDLKKLEQAMKLKRNDAPLKQQGHFE